MKVKTFDCVEMKNKIQEEIYNEIKPSDMKDFLIKIKNKINKSAFIKKFKSNK